MKEIENIRDKIDKKSTGVFKDKRGVIHYLFKGKRHRVDGPAVESSNGTKEWWFNGNLHRLDGPAVESSNGSKSWYLNGKWHRSDGPAVEWVNGSKSFYYYGNFASNEKKFYNHEWRKKTEIKSFL